MTAPVENVAPGVDLVAIAVALGRVEEKLNSIGQNERARDERLQRVENSVSELRADVVSLKTSQRPRTPWYNVVGAVVGVVTGVSVLVGLFITLSVIADAVAKIQQ